MGADELERLREEGQEFVMDDDALNQANDFRVEMERLKEEFAANFRALAGDFIPILKDDLLPVVRDSIIPAIRRFGEFLGELAKWFGNLPTPVQKLILGFVGLLAVAGPILVIVGKLITAIGTIMPIVKSLIAIKKVWAVVQGVLNAVLLANPIGIIILAVLALIGIVWALVANWDKVAEFFSNLWDRVKEIFAAAWEWVKEMFLKYTPHGLIIQHWDKISAFFVGLWDRVKEIFGAAMDWVGDFLRDRWDGIMSFFGNIRDRIVEVFQGVRDRVMSIWRGLLSGIRGIINSLIRAINTPINAINRISVSIPDWVPGWGGKEFSLDIPTIPTLHTGTDFFRPPGGGDEGLALLQRGEAVIPRSENRGREMNHTGTITVRGVNNQGELQGVVDVIMDRLATELRG